MGVWILCSSSVHKCILNSFAAPQTADEATSYPDFHKCWLFIAVTDMSFENSGIPIMISKNQNFHTSNCKDKASFFLDTAIFLFRRSLISMKKIGSFFACGSWFSTIFKALKRTRARRYYNVASKFVWSNSIAWTCFIFLLCTLMTSANKSLEKNHFLRDFLLWDFTIKKLVKNSAAIKAKHGKLWASWWGRTVYFFFGNGVFNSPKRTKRR